LKSTYQGLYEISISQREIPSHFCSHEQIQIRTRLNKKVLLHVRKWRSSAVVVTLWQ